MDTKTRGYETMQVHRFHQDHSENEMDYIVQEYPVALIYNGISHAVMMATPSDLEVFAKGFSLSEGILHSLSELYSLEIRHNALGVEVDMTISSRAFMALKEHRRMMVGRTGCGLCGIESLKQFYSELPLVSSKVSSVWLNQIPSAIAQLKARQRISELTGGAHAAAWVVKGQIVVLFEDVGRHNALDKLLGHLAEQKLNVKEGFVVMTSRASYELIRKCAQYNIGLLATISAPTSMAIEMAKKLNLTLASFCRGDSFVLYTQ